MGRMQRLLHEIKKCTQHRKAGSMDTGAGNGKSRNFSVVMLW